MTDLKNKTAIITGSVRGIGRAIAERYAQPRSEHCSQFFKRQKLLRTKRLKRLKKITRM